MPRTEPAPGARSTRRTPRVLLLAAAVLLVLRVALGVTANLGTRGEVRDRVPWRSPQAGPFMGMASQKPVLYDFTAAWCGPCRALERSVFADSAAAAEIDTLFIPVRVVDRVREDGQNRPEVAELQRRFRVDSFPTLVITGPGGEDPESIVGYAGKDAVLSRLREAAARHRPAP